MKERLLTFLISFGYAWVLVSLLASCNVRKPASYKQKVIFRNHAFHVLIKPHAFDILEGDSVELLITNYKIKLQR